MGYLTAWAQSTFVDVGVSITVAVASCLSISGLILNAILIVSVLRQPKFRQSPTYVTLVSLAASDFFLLLFTPLNIYLMFTGGINSVFCSLYFYAAQVTFSSGATHLSLFSVLRYIILLKPLVSRKYLTVKITVWMCVGIWVVSLTLGIPTALRMDLAPLNTSYNSSVSLCMVSDYSHVYSMSVTVLYGLMPVAVMAFFHILKICQLRKRTELTVQGGKREQVSIKIVVGILIAFVISCTTGLVYWTIVLLSGDITVDTLGIGYLVSVLGYINSAINPLFYFFFSGKIRKNVRCCRRSEVHETVQENITLDNICS